MEEENPLRVLIERFREIYPRDIKPLVEEGHYETAGMELNNVVLAARHGDVLSLKNLRMIPKSISLLTAIELACDDFKEGNPSEAREHLKSVERYLEMTKISTC